MKVHKECIFEERVTGHVLSISGAGTKIQFNQSKDRQTASFFPNVDYVREKKRPLCIYNCFIETTAKNGAVPIATSNVKLF